MKVRSALTGENVLYLDVETQRTALECGGFTRAAMRRRGLAVAVTWRKAQGGYRIYREHDCRQLIADLRASEFVVGFNCRNFDYQVIHGHVRFRTPRTLDLLDVVAKARGFRIGLDALAQGTFGRARPSNGTDNVANWQDGKRSAVERACRRDVLLIRRLHEHMIDTGWVAYLDSLGDRHEFKVPAKVLGSCIR